MGKNKASWPRVRGAPACAQSKQAGGLSTGRRPGFGWMVVVAARRGYGARPPSVQSSMRRAHQPAPLGPSPHLSPSRRSHPGSRLSASRACTYRLAGRGPAGCYERVRGGLGGKRHAHPYTRTPAHPHTRTPAHPHTKGMVAETWLGAGGCMESACPSVRTTKSKGWARRPGLAGQPCRHGWMGCSKRHGTKSPWPATDGLCLRIVCPLSRRVHGEIRLANQRRHSGPGTPVLSANCDILMKRPCLGCQGPF